MYCIFLCHLSRMGETNKEESDPVDSVLDVHEGHRVREEQKLETGRRTSNTSTASGQTPCGTASYNLDSCCSSAQLPFSMPATATGLQPASALGSLRYYTEPSQSFWL